MLLTTFYYVGLSANFVLSKYIKKLLPKMINFQHFTLENGLRVWVHEDHSVPTATVNILYDVGSRDEQEDKTGFAHLFEHLMFGGSKHIAEYDRAAQQAGAINNAFTSPDITNYYLSLPTDNLETALWLESDRMLQLSFDPEVLEVQRKVVIEEFKQRYLNQPYGDVWLKLRPLAYKKHPYRWATIGKDLSHIEKATMDDVRHFYNTYYAPNNAVMVIGGNISFAKVKPLVEKWFGEIPPSDIPKRNLPKEPKQTAYRHQEVESNVPQDALYLTFHMCKKVHADYYPTDLLSDVLGRGKSSRLYQKLVKGKQLFSNRSAYVGCSFDEGLLTVAGRLNESVSTKTGEAAIWEVVNNLLKEGIEKEELNKVKTQAETTVVLSEMDVLNRCINLAQGAIIGDPNFANKEAERIRNVSVEQVLSVANEVLTESNLSALHYKTQKN